MLETIVTAEDARSREEVGVSTSQPVGDDMRIALQEAGRAVRLRHPAFGRGQRLVLSFANNYTSKDGPSAATAFTLLLYSLYDPLKLATDCAITGDIRWTAGCAPWARCHQRSRRAHGRLHIVAIPKENASSVADVPTFYPANTLWKLQIFTVDTLDEALAVMREDRPADLRQAIDLFAAVQRRVGLETPRLSAANKDVIRRSRKSWLAPGNASAAAMLKMLEGRMTETLRCIPGWTR